jgi:hypothetical protein
MNNSVYSKWLFKFVTIDSSYLNDIHAVMKTQYGAGDKEMTMGFSEYDLYSKIQVFKEKNNITPNGAKALVLAFNEIRNLKRQYNITLQVENPDLNWGLLKEPSMSYEELRKWELYKTLSLLLSLVYMASIFLLFFLVFKACN